MVDLIGIPNDYLDSNLYNINVYLDNKMLTLSKLCSNVNKVKMFNSSEFWISYKCNDIFMKCMKCGKSILIKVRV